MARVNAQPQSITSVHTRLALALVIGFASAGGVWCFRGPLHQQAADFDQIVIGARQLIAGLSPYSTTPLPHLTWPIYYPAPSLLLGLPLIGFSLPVAHAIFFGLSAGLAAWALSGTDAPRLFGFATWPFVLSLSLGQWGPLLMASTGIASLGWTAIGKPNLAIAIAAGYGHLWWAQRARWINVSLAAALIGSSFLFRPSWAGEWLNVMRLAHPHIIAPIQVIGGPLLLLGVLRWRRPEARFISALACIPQTFSSYDALLLFLAVKTRREALLLVALTVAITAIIGAVGVAPTYGETVHRFAPLRLWGLYIPTLVMILRRPNEGPAPGWIERAFARSPRWLRGQPAAP